MLYCSLLRNSAFYVNHRCWHIHLRSQLWTQQVKRAGLYSPPYSPGYLCRETHYSAVLGLFMVVFLFKLWINNIYWDFINSRWHQFSWIKWKSVSWIMILSIQDAIRNCTLIKIESIVDQQWNWTCWTKIGSQQILLKPQYLVNETFFFVFYLMWQLSEMVLHYCVFWNLWQ